MATTYEYVCQRCDFPVKSPAPKGVGGVRIHGGHVNASLDATCGQWGWVKRRKNPHAVALGRRGGKVTSAAKAQSSRANGQLGGRPKQG